MGVERLFFLFETNPRYKPQSFTAPRTPGITDRQGRQSVASSNFVLVRLHNNSLAAKSERNVLLHKQEACKHCTAEWHQNVLLLWTPIVTFEFPTRFTFKTAQQTITFLPTPHCMKGPNQIHVYTQHTSLALTLLLTAYAPANYTASYCIPQMT